MAEVLIGSGDQYSGWVGSIFIFNLIVGTGALTLPFAFSKAGWLVSLVVVIVLACMSYITATFVIESMASSNAIIQWRRCQRSKKPEEFPIETSEEETPLLESEVVPDPSNNPNDLYNIQEKVEMGQMVSLLFNKIGVVLFYCCICVYLYGDLAIYCAAVSKSLRDVTCTYSNCSKNLTLDDRCWPNSELSRRNAYRVYNVVFLALLGPFVFFNVQKTKYLQILTSLLRWIAFLTMIILAVIHLANGHRGGYPPLANWSGVPSLFGVCVYSFMCHHSLPSLVTPISNKRKIFMLFAFDYVAILGFYLLLGFTGVFTFSDLSDLYTLNFQPDKCDPSGPVITNVAFISYFLALFPVFTLGTNFPIIGITLRNNLQSLFLRSEMETYNVYLRRILFPLVTILPPAAIAIFSENVGFLVGFTGSYAGAGIQYVVPTLLAYHSRKLSLETFGTGVKNTYLSPFRHKVWLPFVLVWTLSCVALVTVNNIFGV